MLEKENEFEEEIDLRRLLFVIRKSIRFITTVTLICLVAAFVLTNFFITPTYTTSVKLYVDSSTSQSSAALNELNYAQKVVNTYIEMLEEAKVDILLYTTVCDVMMEENTLKGIICHNKDGFCAFFAKVVIDATGMGMWHIKAVSRILWAENVTEKCSPLL